MEGGTLWRHQKCSKNELKMRILNSLIVLKTVKWGIFKVHSVAKVQKKVKGATFGNIQKKSRNAEKLKGGPVVCYAEKKEQPL